MLALKTFWKCLQASEPRTPIYSAANYPPARTKSKSPVDYLLHSLQLREPEIRNVIRTITEQGYFTKTHNWFWYNKATRNIEVVHPCPPIFCLQDPKKTAKGLFKTCEN